MYAMGLQFLWISDRALRKSLEGQHKTGSYKQHLFTFDIGKDEFP